MNKKIIASLDLDGTLLKDDKTISIETKNYLLDFEKKGNFPIINSGRAPRSVINFCNYLEINSPYICYNGAFAYIPSNNKTIKIQLNKEIVKKIYHYLKCNQIIECVSLESDKNIYFDKENEILNWFFSPIGMNVIKGNIEEIINEDVYIMCIVIKEPLLQNKELIKKYFDTIPNYNIRFWSNSNIGEIYIDSVSKASTLKEIAKICGVFEENVVVFGDADNDIELLSEFQNSFCMINGQDYLKTIAKYITKKDNNHDGVISSLDDFINNKL